MWGLNEIHNIADLRRLWPNLIFNQRRTPAGMVQMDVFFCPFALAPTVAEAAQSLAERLIAAGYEARKDRD